MFKYIDTILRKRKNIEYNIYYFGNYMPVVTAWDDVVAMSRNIYDRSIRINVKTENGADVETITYDKLIKVKNAKVLAITNNKVKLINLFKEGDVLSIGKIESFPIVNKILKVRINHIDYDLDVLDSEIPAIITTHDNKDIFDFGTTLYILNLEELTYETFKIDEDSYTELLSKYYNPNKLFKIFSCRSALKTFAENYMNNKIIE